MVTLDQISRKIAKDLNIDEDTVERISRIQFKFLLDNIQSESLEDVQLMYIGKFVKNNYGHKKIRSNIRRLEESSIQG